MLEAKNLTKVYGDKVALDGLSLRIEPGDVFCLLGANGAGKTTTIKLFLNFVAPTSGNATVNGMDVVEHAQATKQFLGYIPEVVNLFPHLSGYENLRYFCLLAGRTDLSIDDLEGSLAKVGIARETAAVRLSQYSKGMRQKVAIAIALAKGAKALLLDEPTSGLDPKASNEFSGLLQDMRRSGVAVLMATHDLFRAKEAGTHLAIMKHGRLAELLPADSVGHQDLERIYLDHMHE